MLLLSRGWGHAVHTECCQEFVSPSWGPYCFAHIPQMFLGNAYPVDFPGDSDVTWPCSWPLLLLLHKAAWTGTPLWGAAEGTASPALLAVSSALSWPLVLAASPSPWATSSPMRSSNALQPWFESPLLFPDPSALYQWNERIKNV